MKFRPILGPPALLCLALNLAAADTVTLSGVVRYEQTPLAGIALTLVGEANAHAFTTSSDDAGQFRFADVPRGAVLVLKAAGHGFCEKAVPVVTDPAPGPLTVLLEPVAVRTDMLVAQSGESAARPGFQFNLTGEALSRLPSGREIDTLMNMIPTSPDGKSMFGGASVDNVFTMDGGEAGDPYKHEWDIPFNLDAVASVVVTANGASAKQRGGQGAVIALKTRRGGNAFEGGIRHIRSRISWNKANVLGQDTGITENRTAVTLGGPIIKDRLWFFTSLETRGYEKTAYYYPTYEEYLSRDPASLSQDTYKNSGHYLMLKISWAPSPADDVDFVYNSTPLSEPFFRNSNIANRSLGTYKEETRNFLLNWDRRFSEQFRTECHLQYKHRPDRVSSPTAAQGGGVLHTIYTPGYTNYHPRSTGLLAHKETDQETRRLTVSGTYDAQWGAWQASLGAGSEWSDKHAQSGWDLNDWVLWNAADGSALLGLYDDPHPWESADEAYLGLYVQTDFTFKEMLTLQIGVRAESFHQTSAGGIVTADAELGDTPAPRLGLTFRHGPYRAGATFGRYYGTTMGYASFAVGDHLFERRDFKLIYSMDELEAMGLRPWAEPEDWAAIERTRHPELWTEDLTRQFNEPGSHLPENLNVPYTDAWSVEIGRDLGAGFHLDLSHTRRAWYDSYEDTDLNHDGLTTLEPFSDTWRRYEATILTLKKNPAKSPLALSFSYTRSSASGFSDWGQLSFYKDSQYHIHNYVGGRLGDYPNQAKLAGSYAFPFGLTAGVTARWRSGATWTPLIYVRDTYPGSAYANGWRPVNYELEGSRRYEPFTNTDLRLSYRFPKMRGVATALEVDVFNLFNQQREIAVDRGVGYGHYDTDAEPGSQAWLDYVHTHAPVLDVPRAAFGKVTAYSTPRRFMLNAVVRF